MSSLTLFSKSMRLTAVQFRQFSSSIHPLKPAADLDRELDKLAELAFESKKQQLPKLEKDKVDRFELLKTFKKYDPKVQTERVVVPGVNRPIPINVELNYYSPLKHAVKYGDLKAEVVFKCFDTRNLEFFCDFALRAAYYLGMPATGPKPVPVKRERWTVIRAPFVHAKSKENFERRTYGRVIRIWDSTEKVVDTWLAYLKQNSVWGVGVKASMYVNEPLDISEKMVQLPESEKVLTDLSSTLRSLSKDSENPVAAKVLELLQDPMFTKHMSSEEVEDVRQAESDKKM
ncbi:hypothetical protein FOA43_002852 [Brettanomyces nanus]|uniref:Small ribosomal subunit protein uS10m n=1 Tax=Eeniella nana TaxID=13502 RepID=A0A875RVF7_EENNA|nr:uncharacterized protein FOA43_002852 [Brettanomyces nanus]QPG75497.1 hypothetical protein FOA43_002852 [Brettanomyces nanus]